MISTPTPSEFWDKLNQHDWFYEYSDDTRVWRKGSEREGWLRTIASKDPVLKALYEGFKSHHFSGKAFNSEKVEKPTRPEE